jgi:hypothetical protein
MNKQISGRKDYDPASGKQGGYSGKIPIEAISDLDGELAGLVDGKAFLTLHIRDGHLARWYAGGEAYAEGVYSGKTPYAAFRALEKRLTGLARGTATLTLRVKDGELEYTTGRQCSHVPEHGDGE